MLNPYKRYPSTVKSLFLLLIGALLGAASLRAQGNCDCTNCPQFMPDGFTGSFLINVQNASNPTLGQNGQGVCGVVLNFDHEYLGDLSITLTSPGGQTVTLVGPIGFFGPTDGTSWNVTFLPCGDSPVPDPGFSANWNNNQPWGLFGNYTGSYYPYNGCLENFMGPVNGTWTLTVTDGQAIDVGNFYDYEIIFCDPSGIDCFSCAANAGNLLQPDVNACEGSSNLNLNLPPTYPNGQNPPPASDYSYTYVIGGAGGVIQAYDPGPDLTAYPPGAYTVCGLSYLTAQEGDIPVPNGALTINQLTTQLNSSMPPFCGKITTNCVNVTINPAAPDEEEFVDICAPQCYIFHNQVYCQSGTYIRNLTTAQGCPYVATLYLTVHQPSFTSIVEFVCIGDCSQTPGFETACTPNVYQESFTNAAGCDSTVTLTLSNIIAIANIVQPVPQVGCSGSVQLSGTGSSTGIGVTYLWTASNGGNIVGSPNGINVQVNAPGDYELMVCRTNGGVTCCEMTAVTVTGNQNPPAAPAAVIGNNTACAGQPASFSVAPVAGATGYTWTVPPGVTINSGQNTPAIDVTWGNVNGGNVCVTANNACGNSAPICLTVSIVQVPTATAPVGNATVCQGQTTNYSTSVLPGASTYNWVLTPATATITAGQGTNQISVNWGAGAAGTVCVSASNNCGAGPQACLPVQIGSIPSDPVVAGNFTPCAGSTENYTITPIAGTLGYNWSFTGGSWTGVGGNGAPNIQILWDPLATTGTLCANAYNSCGATASICTNITLTPGPAQPDISGDATLCAGASGNYTIPAIPNATGYVWTVPAGATIANGQNTTAITVNWPAGNPGGDVCAAATGGCGTGPQDCFPVALNAVPVANAGVDGAICGTVFNLQAVPSVPGSTGFWTVVSGGTATFVDATNATTGVTAATNGVYVFEWTEANGLCNDNDQVSVSFNAAPSAGAILPDCDGTNDNFTISFPITGGTAPYTVPGGTVTGSTFTSDPIPNAVNYSFVITDANGCASPAVAGAYNCDCATNAGTMPLTPLQACENQTVTATSDGNANFDANDIGAYVLHTNSGPSLGTVVAQNTTGTFGYQAGMIYGQTYYISFVVGNNVGGAPDLNDLCLSVAQGQPAVFNQNPTADAGTDAATCDLVLTINGNTSVGTGVWTVASAPPGGNLIFGNAQNATTTATADLPGAYTLTWTLDNNGCTAADQVVLNFNAAPAPGLAVEDCDGANENYTLSFPISGGLAPYSVNGAPVAGNNFTSTPIPSGGAYSFTVTDANGCAAPALTGLFNCDCATNAGQMDATPLSACEGATVTAQHLGGQTLDANDVTAFVLHTGNGTTLGAVIEQNATGIFGFQAGMTYGQTYYVSFVVGNNLGGFPDPNDPCFSVATGEPAVFYQNPTPSAGADDAVCGNVLTLAGDAGNGAGAWTVTGAPPGGNLTIIDSQNPATDVNASTFGVYTLLWTVTENGCTGTDQVIVQFNETPALAGLSRDCDGTGENFTVTLTLSGGTPPYTVNGATVAGNTFTSAPFANGLTYTFAVTDANGCAMPDIVGAYSCNCLTNAGTMDLQQLTVCEDATVTAQANNDQTLDGNDVTAFVLHTGTGAALGTVLAENATGTFGFQAGMSYGTVYYISRVAGNSLAGVPNPADPCFSVAPGQPVVFLKNPTPEAGPNTAICAQTIALQAANDNFAGTWSQVSGPGTATFNAPGQQNSGVTVDAYGAYVFRWTEDNNGCIGTDNVTVTFNESPSVGIVAEDCNGINTAFIVSFTVSGGAPAYSLSGLNGSFNGNTFQSVELINGSAYTFTVTDANGCTSAPITGAHNCDCATDAGTMNAAPLIFCADQPAVAVWNNDAQTDANDIVRFILHDQAGNTLGTVFATSQQPSFTFNAGLQYGFTYYISAIAGDGMIGGVNLNDPCLSIAPGTPVQWKPLPTASLTGDASLCNGESATLHFSGTGQFPLTVNYADDQGNQYTLTIPGAQPVDVPLQPTATTIYAFVSVVDGTLPACSVLPTDVVQISVSQPVEAGTAATPFQICAGQNTLLQLGSLLTGADANGIWTETSAVPSAPGGFNAAAGAFQIAGQNPATYTFRYALDAAAPCPDDDATVTVVIHPQTVADAGPNILLDCIEISALLGGSNTSTGSDVTYAWSLDGVPLGNATGSQLEVTAGGAYTLVTNNSAGCSDQDVTVVTVDNEAPQASAITVHDVRCYGETNGFILVDSVSGGQPPVLISLNNGPFGGANLFAGLDPGFYVVTLQGANGCTWSSDTLELVEPEELTANLGADVEAALGDLVYLEAVTSLPLTELDTVVWNPLLDSTRAGTLSQQFLPLHSWQVSVTVTDLSGCTATDRLAVIVDRHRNVFVPNIIAPASGQNGILTVYGGQDVAEIESFQLYDRWGERIFEAFSFQPEAVSWTGQFRGEDVLPGVYVYYARIRFIDGETEIFTGDVTVYR